MFEDRYADKFGFTSGEVEKLLAYHKITQSIDEVARWYDSYSAGQIFEIYNPWSIICFCADKQLKLYWIETGYFYSTKSRQRCLDKGIALVC
jgi:hypothetical protein